MGLRVDFNTPIDGGGGRVDVMRVLATSWQDSNDFSGSLIFSSNYPSAQIEEYAAYTDAVQSTGTASGSFYPSRLFGAPPFVFAVFNMNDGQHITPYFFNQVYSRPASGGSGDTVTTLERQDCFQVDVVDTGGGGYRVDWVVYNFGPGAPLINGTVRLRLVGKAP